jgi:LacI family transcriptional regulator
VAVTRRPTMPDVARAAGVSVKTVSRVINDEPNVSPTTHERVVAAIGALGFRRNDVARNLRSGTTSSSVGLVIGDLANPFYGSIAQAIQAVAAPRQFMVVVGSSEEGPGREQELVAALLRRRVDGLLITPTGSDQRYLVTEMEMGTPMVFLDRPPVGCRADCVVVDNRRGAKDAVAHLAAQGHRTIAVVGDSLAIPTARERMRGYHEALAVAGLPEDPTLVVLGPHTPAQAEAATDALLERDDPPTAFFTTNNRMTLGVLRSLWRRGHAADVAGFDDFELADLLPIPFMVVAHDPAEMGRRGAELLFARIDAGGGAPAKPRRVVLPTTLVPRGIRP